MLVRLVVNWVAMAVAFGVTDWLLGGLNVSGGVGSYLWVALLFGIVNAIIGTFLRIIALPFTVLTLGLFLIVINAALLEITAAITSHLTIDSFFWTAIWAAIILSVVDVIIDVALFALLPSRAVER